jgi:diadenosine tetraphosphate (Ap4A) HIT family hydrolase
VTCPFCHLDRPLLESSELALAIADAFPVSPGHSLVVPRRHVPSYFDCNASEKRALWALVDRTQERLSVQWRPHGFNIGINVGAAAGQTVAHAHVHVIPRYDGDLDDPRGGVRSVIPGKARY